MYDTFLEELSERALMENFQAPLLVPIPLSGRRRRERGYNQAELLCRELLKAGAGDPVYSLSLATDILFKPEDTEHQARIKHRQKRMENLRGTFVVKNAERITGRNIVLIDDIVTTGATLMEARRVLEAAGARKIIAFTVAH